MMENTPVEYWVEEAERFIQLHESNGAPLPAEIAAGLLAWVQAEQARWMQLDTWAEAIRKSGPRTQGQLIDLAHMLCQIADSEEAKEEAERIAAAIYNTFLNNERLMRLPPSAERNKGYWCYEWAYAFLAAAKHESSDQHYILTVEWASAGDNVHYWIVVESRKSGDRIYVDDGFANGRYVHFRRPVPLGYKYMGEEPSTPVYEQFRTLRDSFRWPKILDHKNKLVKTPEHRPRGASPCARRPGPTFEPGGAGFPTEFLSGQGEWR
ncbi:MAG TPA: hypothetical protein EYP04_01635 [Anaerolineae bacterium]|nr:hypothetical protein [Anaerolineae bacterium]